jgi:hypothetical protein|tara:strand:- start:74 stop:388 length:315 start_codon:yes stop_codon:yes gene_type:complete
MTICFQDNKIIKVVTNDTKNLPSKARVFIIAKDHAKPDSLPLRYGFYYKDDKWIDIKRTSAPTRNKQEDNIEFTEEITDHEGISHEGPSGWLTVCLNTDTLHQI